MAFTTVKFDGADEVQKKIRALMLDGNPKFERALHNLIRASLKKGVKVARQSAKGKLGEDPHKSFLGIRSLTWLAGKSSKASGQFGGNISMLSRMRAARKPDPTIFVTHPRKLDQNPHQRGGNRMKRSKYSDRMDGYSGLDRQMVMMWNSLGAKRPGKTARRYSDSHLRQPARRGNIAPRGVFQSVAPLGMQAAEQHLIAGLEKLVAKFWEDHMANISENGY